MPDDTPSKSVAFPDVAKLMAGKRGLIMGVANERSIAWGIAQAMRREGAELALTYQNEKLKQRVDEFARELGSDIALPCDLGSDEQIQALFDQLGEVWPEFDGLVHSIGFAPREAIAGDFLEGMTRENFRIAHDISSYSFTALAKAAMPMMLGRNASLLTLSYLGAMRVVPAVCAISITTASSKRRSMIQSVRIGAGRLARATSSVTRWPRRAMASSELRSMRLADPRRAKNVGTRRNAIAAGLPLPVGADALGL